MSEISPSPKKWKNFYPEKRCIDENEYIIDFGNWRIIVSSPNEIDNTIGDKIFYTIEDSLMFYVPKGATVTLGEQNSGSGFNLLKCVERSKKYLLHDTTSHRFILQYDFLEDPIDYQQVRMASEEELLFFPEIELVRARITQEDLLFFDNPTLLKLHGRINLWYRAKQSNLDIVDAQATERFLIELNAACCRAQLPVYLNEGLPWNSSPSGQKKPGQK